MGIKNKVGFLSTGSALVGMAGRILDGGTLTTMLLYYGADTPNYIIGSFFSLLYNALIGFGIAGLLCLAAPWVYEQYKRRKEKTYTVPFARALVYLYKDSILSNGFKAEDTIKSMIDVVNKNAFERKIKVYGREVSSNICGVIDYKYFAPEYGITSKESGTENTIVLTSKKDNNPIFVGLCLNEKDMLETWPPHDKSFIAPSSWMGKELRDDDRI